MRKSYAIGEYHEIIGTDCPCCDGVIDGPPALSRGRDREVFVCTPCGQKEALEDFYAHTAHYGPIECPNCGRYRRCDHNDYLCWECRRNA